MNLPYLLLTIAIFSILTYRTLKSNKSYVKFKQFKKTAERQKSFKSWIIESFLMFGGLGVIMLIATDDKYNELLAQVNASAFGTIVSQNQGVIIGFIAALVFGTILGAVAQVKSSNDAMKAAGDIEAMQPTNKVELKFTTALSINAGIVEELFFRLALPALLFATTNNAIIAIAASVLIFGLVHWYQGLVGVIFTGILGAILMAMYLTTGNLLFAIVVHALIDLRSLAFVPYLQMRHMA